jgi:ATP-dependent helicase/nuclease subunit B
MQRELEMPGTDAALDGEQARRVTERIASSAETVVFSYAHESGKGQQRPSASLAGLDLEKIGIEKLVSAAAARTVVELEEMEDAARIEVPPDVVMRGGATVLQLQAACGFRAFAEMRLRATEIEDIELGMDARERGNVVHKALECFWNEVKTQRELKTMPEDKREEVLSRTIDEGLKRTAELSATAWDAAYLDMQRRRLHDLLRPWLELEMARPAFEVKLSEKEFNDVAVGPLRLSVRVDRVDVSAGGEIIIDYKTGLAKPADWLTERPDAPQLPLYAILPETQQLEAVAFAQVRAGKEMGLHGFATSRDVLVKTTKLPQGVATLEVQVEEWRRVLTKLAEDFYRGDTRVRPKNYPVTCAHCGQRLLCRLNAAELGGDEETEAIDG